VIHTNGGLKLLSIGLGGLQLSFGALQNLGHMDFYANGGSAQGGNCAGEPFLASASCSHTRATQYYLFSITENNLFPSKPCPSVLTCNWTFANNNGIVAFMGEAARERWDSNPVERHRSLFFTPVSDCFWSWKRHSPKC